MKINRKEFQEILNEFSKSAPKKSKDKRNRAFFIGPYSGEKCIVALKTGDLVIRCFLDRDGLADEKERTWLNVDTVKSIVSGKCSDEDTVKITRDEELVVIECDSIETSILPVKEMEGVLKVGKRKWREKFYDIDSEELHKSLSYVNTSLCETPEKKNVFGAYFNFKAGELVCCDHCSVKISKIGKIEEDGIVIFPSAAKSLERVLKVMKKQSVLCEVSMELKKNPSWVAFSFETVLSTWVVQSKLSKEAYTDYRSVEPKEPFFVDVHADDLKRRIAHIQKMKLKSVKMRIICDSKIVDLESGGESGKVFIPLKVESNGYSKDGEYKVYFDPSLFQKTLNGASGKQMVGLLFEEEDNFAPVKIELENGNSSTLAAMRLG